MISRMHTPACPCGEASDPARRQAHTPKHEGDRSLFSPAPSWRRATARRRRQSRSAGGSAAAQPADAWPNSQPRERRGEPVHVRLERPVRHRPIEEDQRRCVRILSGTPFEEAGQRDVLKLEDRRNAGVVEPMPGLGRHLLSGRSENSDHRAEYEASYHQQAAEAVLASLQFPRTPGTVHSSSTTAPCRLLSGALSPSQARAYRRVQSVAVREP